MDGDGEDVRSGPQPPRWWERLFRALVPAGQREAALGDAAEEFAARVRGRGPAGARRWYRRQVLASIVPGAIHALRRVVDRQGRRAEGDGSMSMWTRDLALTWRALRRRPGFTALVVTTLALGVGANTALFGVFRAVFLRPLPLPEPDELVVVMEAAGFGCCGPASGPDYLDWVERNRSFSAMAALDPGPVTLTGLDEAERVYATNVTASAFDMLGVAPLLGRALVPEDQDGPSVVVLAHGLWQRVLGARTDVLGTTLEVDGNPLTIVGVMPKGFDVPSPWGRTRAHQLYVPFDNERLAGSPRGNHGFPVVARLAPGVTLEAAQADMDRVMRELGDEYPRTNAERSAHVFSVHEYLYGDVGKQLGMILGAAGVVLLIACGNVAGLLLARAAGRGSELSVRAALGASRGTLARLLFAESLTLAALGGAGGVLVSFAALDAVRSLLPPSIPRVDAVGIDGWALAFALGASALTAIVFGMVPAILASRADLASGVKQGGYATLAPAKERMRDAFIVGQIALGLVLANGAGLLVQSYARLRAQGYGFRPEGVLTLAVSPAGPRYDDGGARQRYYEEVGERIGALPGVTGVGYVSKLPLSGGSNGNVLVEGRGPRSSSDEGPLVEVSSVTGDYFEAMGIALLTGRTLVAEDSAVAAKGAVINRTFAESVWPEEDALGKRFSFTDDPPDWFTVVGVVGDVRQWGLEREPIAEAYFPYGLGFGGGGWVVARVGGDPAAAAPAVRRAILEVDPAQPPSDVRTMTDRVESAYAQRRFYTTLIGLFAVAALFLAAAGVYGTVSYFVARRVREMGIRIALGAGGSGIVGLVLRRGVRLAFWGVVIGLGGVWASTSVLEGLVYGIRSLDLFTLAAGCAALAGVAVVASCLPAVRAVRVSPVLALRSE